MRQRLLITSLLLLLGACPDSPGEGPLDPDPGEEDSGLSADVDPGDIGSDLARDAGVDSDVHSDAGAVCGPENCLDPNETCHDTDTGPVCECRPGSVRLGEACSEIETCTADTCNRRGSCSDDGGAALCDCDEGYGGVACEVCAGGFHDDGAGGCTDDACTPNPCDTDRVCVAGSGQAVCQCPPGSHDEEGFCLQDTECRENTCNQQGACADGGGSVSCDCNDGWAEPFCANCDAVAGYHDDGEGGCTMDPCVPNPCQAENRSLCSVDELGAVDCGCDPEHHLEAEACVPDEVCEEDTCNGRGDCAVESGRTVCACDEAFTGPDCSSCNDVEGFHPDGDGGCTDDPCTPNPCDAANKTDCVADGQDYLCECDEGFHDDLVGGCSDDPCVPDLCRPENQACRADLAGEAECYTPECFDNNPCTQDLVDVGRCSHPDEPGEPECSDSLCFTGQTCFEGVCGGGTEVTCPDLGVCVEAWCDDDLGCQRVNDDVPIPDDGYSCTDDYCEGGVPINDPIDSRCGVDSYCAGDVFCDPDQSTAADGCAAISRPVRPGPDGPCGSWVCDNDQETFVFEVVGVGEDCNDGLGCTRDDVCRSDGACAGVVAGDCTVLGCDVTATLENVDIAPARVRGRVLYNGATPDLGSESTTGITLYLRSHTTGSLKALENVSFSGSSMGGVYPLYTNQYYNDLTIDLAVMPGVYDVVYARDGSGDYDYTPQGEPNDAYAFGFHVIQPAVVIGPGLNALDVDVAPVQVTGQVLYGGLTPALGSESTTGIALYLRSHETGSLKALENVSFSGSASEGVYPLYTNQYYNDLTIDLAVLPGVYDVVYARDGSGSYDYTPQGEPGDAYAFGFHVLVQDVVIGPGSTELDVEVAPVQVTGQVHYDSVTPTLGSQSTTSIVLYLRSHETGSLKALENVSFSGSSVGGVYPLYTNQYYNDLSIDLAVLPGVYDIVYARDGSGDYDYTPQGEPDDAYAFGFHVIQQGVVIGPGPTDLNVEIAPVRVTGQILYDGVTPDLGSESTTGIVLYLRSNETGSLKALENVSFSGSSVGGVYPLYTNQYYNDLSVDLAVLPGVYDIVYARDGSGDYDYTPQGEPGDAYAFGFHVIRQDVVIGPGATDLDVDVTPVRVTGRILYDGATLGLGSESTTGIVLYLRSHETGSLKALENVTFSGSSVGGVYPLYTNQYYNDLNLDLAVLPGVYDIVYARDGSGDYDYTPQGEPGDAYAFGFHVIQQDVVIGPGPTVLDVDVAPSPFTGSVLYDGSTPELGSESTTGIVLYLRSYETDSHKALENVTFSGRSSGGVYPLYTNQYYNDLSIDLALLPGVYDVIYARDGSGDYDYTTQGEPDDAYAFGFTTLGRCIQVE